MKFAIIVLVVCFSVQALARPQPQDGIQDFIESMKRRIQDALSQVQEMANRAIETARAAVQAGFVSAQRAAKQGLESGQNWAHVGETTFRKIINSTGSALPALELPDSYPGETTDMTIE